MLEFIVFLSISILICCAFFIIAQALALRKSKSAPEIAILRDEKPSAPPEVRQEPEQRQHEAPKPSRRRASRSAPGGADNEVRTVLSPHSSRDQPNSDPVFEHPSGPP